MSTNLGPLQLQWLEALESGKYIQGRDCLVTTGGKFCCLGVACDLFAGVKAFPVQNNIHGKMAYIGETNYLPPIVINKLCFFSSDGAQDKSLVNKSKSIAQMNDEGMTFKEIAAVIRKNPERFFSRPV